MAKPLFLDVQVIQQPPQPRETAEIHNAVLMNETWAFWDCEDLGRPCPLHIKWAFGYEEAVSMKGAPPSYWQPYC